MTIQDTNEIISYKTPIHCPGNKCNNHLSINYESGVLLVPLVTEIKIGCKSGVISHSVENSETFGKAISEAIMWYVKEGAKNLEEILIKKAIKELHLLDKDNYLPSPDKYGSDYLALEKCIAVAAAYEIDKKKEHCWKILVTQTRYFLYLPQKKSFIFYEYNSDKKCFDKKTTIKGDDHDKDRKVFF